ncbi:MAG: hypothetical protein LUD72_06165 [Bacteroidales bacterium]|nr:hypothetical protein [Bacteroidales bacterium]
MKVIQKKIGKESFISRLPALFAYIEEDDVGVVSVHTATDSKNGCYGKVVENMTLPDDKSLKIDNETLLAGGNTYTYRTLIRYYYQYRDELENDNPFISFIDTAIGRRNVADKLGEDFLDEHDLCPRTVYIASAAMMYDEYVKMWKACKIYEERKKSEGADEQMCCYCEKFERMGGETMMNLLTEYAQEATGIAETYYGYAKDSNPLNLQMSIFLSKSEDDLGLVTPYIEEWEGGKKYYACDKDNCTNPYFDDEDNGYLKYEQINGDKVYYDGKTYTTNETNTGKHNDTTDAIDFYYDKFTPDTPIQFSVGKGNIPESIEITGKCASNLKSLRRYTSYFNAYDEIDAPDDDEDWLYYYRVGLIYNLETVNDDFGNILMFDGNGDPIQYSKKDEKDDESNIPKDGATVTNLLAYGDIITKIEPVEGSGNAVSLTKTTESGTDECGNAYSEGAWINDNTGCTYTLVTAATNSGTDKCGNPYSAGDWIYTVSGCKVGDSNAITLDFSEYSAVEFTYILGAHLTATCKYDEYDDDGNPVPSYDDDGNPIVKYENFKYDDEDIYHGVTYVETHSYDSDSDLAELVSGERTIGNTKLNFNDYINGVYDITSTETDTVVDMYSKYEFSTISDSDRYTKRVGHQEVEVDTVMADFTAYNKNKYDWQLVNTVRLDYLQGISMQPLTDVDVSIQRGITAVYEKNLKFAEVKTLEDMENYSNGSFFPMIEGA